MKSAAAAVALLLLAGLLAGCSGYSGITTVQRPAEAKDALPAGIRSEKPDLPSDFRLLAEDNRVKYFAAESPERTTACIAAYPVDKPDQWMLACSDGITGEREIVTTSHMGQPTVKLVTTGFDTKALESEGWRKVHANVLVGAVANP
ncbi:hypothetical protein LRQ04_04250 [Paenarthrobacter sp. AR 02]|uniref:hypothetical protein n=1 Tax=Paenarthrobacter sp. AR 02 TaxID=2899821 RepID=UPI001F198AA3|nr:hypothetical protein [Paenarthrobacter sp. AR 02]MCF3138464.1 hypothetical protein [Paenarthrobacter sp. AR 02]